MKKIFLLFFLGLTCTAARSQVGLLFSFAPENAVLSVDEFSVSAEYMHSGKTISAGLFATSNNDFSVLYLGAKTATKVISPSDKISLNLITGFAFNIDEDVESRFSEPHHRHYLEAGIQLTYSLDESMSLTQQVTRQFWGFKEVTSASIGVSVKL